MFRSRSSSTVRLPMVEEREGFHRRKQRIRLERCQILASGDRLLGTHQTASYGYDVLLIHETTCSTAKALDVEPKHASFSQSLVSESTVRCYFTAPERAHTASRMIHRSRDFLRYLPRSLRTVAPLLVIEMIGTLIPTILIQRSIVR